MSSANQQSEGIPELTPLKQTSDEWFSSSKNIVPCCQESLGTQHIHKGAHI